MVVTISSTKNDHLESAEVNCLKSKLCVPLAENDITARKLRDKDIREVLHFEVNAIKRRNFKKMKPKLYQNLAIPMSL